MDKIIIKGLKIDAIIGILPHEREFEQPLILDITLEHSLQKCIETGDLNQSIDYASVCNEVTKFVKERKALLIESLADDICQYILEKYRPSSVTLKILKTNAVLNTQGVGVQITRTRED